MSVGAFLTGFSGGVQSGRGLTGIARGFSRMTGINGRMDIDTGQDDAKVKARYLEKYDHFEREGRELVPADQSEERDGQPTASARSGNGSGAIFGDDRGVLSPPARAARALGGNGGMIEPAARAASTPTASSRSAQPTSSVRDGMVDYGGGLLPASLVRTESGGNWQASNNIEGSGGTGHFGRGQFSRGRLADAARAGVIPEGVSPTAFMADPEMQRRVEAWHVRDIQDFINDNGLGRFVGQTVNGIEVTPNGMLAVAHLGGSGGLRRHLESGGRYNPSDAFGTSLSDYMRTHAGGGVEREYRSAPRLTRGGTQSARRPSAWVQKWRGG